MASQARSGPRVVVWRTLVWTIAYDTKIAFAKRFIFRALASAKSRTLSETFVESNCRIPNNYSINQQESTLLTSRTTTEVIPSLHLFYTFCNFQFVRLYVRKYDANLCGIDAIFGITSWCNFHHKPW